MKCKSTEQEIGGIPEKQNYTNNINKYILKSGKNLGRLFQKESYPYIKNYHLKVFNTGI